MKKLDLDIKLPKSLPKQEVEAIEKLGKGALFGGLLSFSVTSVYGEGKIPAAQGKVLASIQDKIEELDPSVSELEVDAHEVDFIRTVFYNEKLTLHAEQCQLVTRFLDKIFN